MKKFLKVLTIIILVGLSIAAACLIFFYNYNKNRDKSFNYINSFLTSARVEEVDSKISEINTTTSGRFNSYIKTKENLDDIAWTLNGYLINQGSYKINEKAVINKLKEVEESLDVADDMADEFNLKSSSEHFNTTLGSNDLFAQSANTLKLYSDALIELNAQLDKLNLNKDADIKFAMIDAYLQVTVDSFSNLKEESGVKVLSKTQNISLFNNLFKLENSILITNCGSNFSQLNNQFVRYYNACDKTAFAKDLSKNVSDVVSFSESQSATQNAAFYFKAIYGV